MIWVAIFAGIVALVFSGILAWYVNKQDMGSKRMIEIYHAIREGSKAYLKRQYKSISIISIILAEA